MPAKKSTSSRKRTTTASAKKTPAKARTRKPAAPQKVELAVRNLANCPVGLRLERQQEGKRRINLKPRGERGDFFLLQDGDEKDPVIVDNVNLGLIEFITQAEATNIAHKQTTNQQQVHPALAMLRNEKGEPYPEGAVKVEQSFEEQGVVVAELVDGNVVIGRGGIERHPQQTTPDQVRRSGDSPAQSAYVTHSVPPDQQAAAAADAKARGKNLQGPAAGLPDGIKVTVAPPQKG